MKRFLRLFSAFRKLEVERDRLQADLARRVSAEADAPQFFPAGHFYSPLPSRAEIADAFQRGGFGPPFPGIELNEAGQLARLQRFFPWYVEQPFPEKATSGWRFYLENPSYGHFDAIILYGMLREARPRRII